MSCFLLDRPHPGCTCVPQIVIIHSLYLLTFCPCTLEGPTFLQSQHDLVDRFLAPPLPRIWITIRNDHVCISQSFSTPINLLHVQSLLIMVAFCELCGCTCPFPTWWLSLHLPIGLAKLNLFISSGSLLLGMMLLFMIYL